jgi:hypothetical protein
MSAALKQFSKIGFFCCGVLMFREEHLEESTPKKPSPHYDVLLRLQLLNHHNNYYSHYNL